MTNYNRHTKHNNDVNKQSSELALKRLADLKFQFDLLSNELFHLKQYVSLVEFDPAYRNETESFHRFLKNEQLNIDASSFMKENYNENKVDSETARRRGYQLRASSTLKDESS